ncbi:MAG: hypothetical protein CMN49_02835 [SAR116 cluster bacterium]|nr:hypothetical protein [SAR116 cluster bacterium]
MTLSTHGIFESLVIMHIITGTVGLISVWIPIACQKGGVLHRQAGNIFITSMLTTGLVATGISITTLADPTGTHPHLSTHEVFQRPEMISGIFGWMMLYLATLTINLAWHGWLCMRNKRDHKKNGAWHNLLLQVVLTATSANCFIRGIELAQPMMMGIAFVGFATVATNLWFIYRQPSSPKARIKEHIKSLVGAGISVYTAFFAFGAVRLLPELALTPGLWAIPLVTGLTLIIYHQRAVMAPVRRVQPT